jgi:hypothetical protein
MNNTRKENKTKEGQRMKEKKIRKRKEGKEGKSKIK